MGNRGIRDKFRDIILIKNRGIIGILFSVKKKLKILVPMPRREWNSQTKFYFLSFQTCWCCWKFAEGRRGEKKRKKRESKKKGIFIKPLLSLYSLPLIRSLFKICLKTLTIPLSLLLMLSDMLLPIRGILKNLILFLSISTLLCCWIFWVFFFSICLGKT